MQQREAEERKKVRCRRALVRESRDVRERGREKEALLV